MPLVMPGSQLMLVSSSWNREFNEKYEASFWKKEARFMPSRSCPNKRVTSLEAKTILSEYFSEIRNPPYLITLSFSLNPIRPLFILKGSYPSGHKHRPD